MMDVTSAEFLFHGDVGAFDLPLVGLGTEGEDLGLVAFGRRVEQLRDQTVGVGRMMMHQLGQRSEPAL